MLRRLLTLFVVLIATAVTAPAGASADAFTLGPPTLSFFGSGVYCSGTVCNQKVYTQLSTSQAGATTVAPYNGTVTSWRVLKYTSGTGASTLRLRVLRPTGSTNQFTSVGRSAPAVATDGSANSTNLTVRQGDQIGVELYDTGSSSELRVSNRETEAGTIGGFPVGFLDGTTQTVESTINGRLQLNAAVEFTPASSPGGATTGPSGSPALPRDTTKPSISFFGLTPSAFQAANVGGAVISAVGTQVVFELSEPGTVSFTVDRAATGRRSKGKCRKPTRKLRRAKKCTRYLKVKGSFSRTGAKGLNRFRFSGRIGGRSLRPGSYRLNATATDAARNKSKVRAKTFRVTRPRR